jgi:hypothetical protein
MDKVLITNIGNRSLIGVKNGLNEIKPKMYRQETEIILKTIEEDISFLDGYRINILDALLDKEKGFTHIYLFVSDQQGAAIEEQYKSQDTLYAGEVIKKLILKEYHSIKTENIVVVPFTCTVVDANELLPNFRKSLKEILVKHPNSEFIISDSGGTPQQKTSLKIAAEYLLPQDKVSYFQILETWNEDGSVKLGDSKLKSQDNQEYRKIIDAQQIALLIDNGNYAAAAYIYSETSKIDFIYKSLKCLEYRSNLLTQDAINQIQGIDKKRLTNSFNTFKDIKNPQMPWSAYQNWENLLNREDFLRLYEILSLASFYEKLEDWTNVVLFYHIFIETFLYSVIVKRHPDYNLNDLDNFDANKDKLKDYINDVANSGANVKIDIFSYVYSITPPVTIDFVRKNWVDIKITEIVDTFRKCNSNWNRVNNKKAGLDKLRNEIAHKGKGISSKEEIKNIISDFDKYTKLWRNSLGLGNIDNNVYLQANKEIKEALKMND